MMDILKVDVLAISAMSKLPTFECGGAPVDYVPQAVTKARTAPAPVGYEHPDYPWIPFQGAGPVLAGQVRAWAAAQGIPMPPRGIPRSVLLTYRRRQTSEQSTAKRAAALRRDRW